MILREKILVGLVAAAAVGAAMTYAPAVFSPDAAESKRKPIDFATLSTSVQVNLKKVAASDREKRLLAAATTEWLGNPLRDRPLEAEEPDKPDFELPEYIVPLPVYVGYIRIGDKEIAIIDGQDYRPGETLSGGEFQLVQIYPDHVELLRRGAVDPVKVPLEEPTSLGNRRSGGEPQ